MAIYELRNDTVAIGLESLGAELKSLKRLDTGTESWFYGNLLNISTRLERKLT